MARAYSGDLRRKLLEAHGAGKGTLRELAERFGVSVPWAWKVSAAHKRSGAVERAPQLRHGLPSRVDRAQVRALLKAKPDLVLRELREELERQAWPSARRRCGGGFRGCASASKKISPHPPPPYPS